MQRNRRNEIAGLALALLLALAPPTVAAGGPAAVPTAAEPENWTKLFRYAGCAASVYVGLQTGGATLVVAAAVCATAFSEESK
jgi:hypothetical protein